MYAHSPLWHYLWVGPAVFQILIAALMIRRRLHSQFPWFWVYTTLQVVMTGTLFVMDHSEAVSPQMYWYAYLASDLLCIVLRFGMIYELVSQVFRPYQALRQLATAVFQWTAVGLLFLGVLVASYASPEGTHPLLAGINILDRSVSVVQCGLLLFLFIFSKYFGLSWRSDVFGIALGLGILASVQLAISAIAMQSGGGTAPRLYDFLTMGTYHVCVLIWLAYVLAPEPARHAISSIPANDVESWSVELRRLLQQR